MKTKSRIFIGFIILLGLGLAGSASAHNPRIVDKGGETVKIQNPEISQAFYGQLYGQAQIFEINSEKNFTLYVGVLVPKAPNTNKDISAEIYYVREEGDDLIAELGGIGFDWVEFYEPFGGDIYLKGPEFKKEVGSGKYLVRVLSLGNQGKYSLAIGEKESFPPKEILNTILLLPVLKKDFFGRSPLTAYFNYTGLFLLSVLLILAAIIFLIVKLVKRKCPKAQENFKESGRD